MNKSHKKRKAQKIKPKVQKTLNFSKIRKKKMLHRI